VLTHSSDLPSTGF